MALDLRGPAAAVVVALASLWGSPASGAAVYRAVLVQGTGTGTDDAAHLKDALVKAANWTDANVQVIPFLPRWTWEEVKTEVAAKLGAADDDDVSLFYIGSHGITKRDKDADEPSGELKNDEWIQTAKVPNIVDDLLDEPFKNIKGLKILVFDTCWSGGLADGAQDFAAAPTVGSWTVISSTGKVNGRNTKCYTNVRKDGTRSYWTHQHSIFTGFLVDGLSDNGSGVPKADGADAGNDVSLAE